MDRNPRQDGMNRQHLENHEFDRELDTALAKFATAEPRTGIEERILVNLRTERRRSATYAWWRWPVAAALAAIVVSVLVTWRPGKPVQNTAAQSPATTRSARPPRTQVANNDSSGPARPCKAISEKRLKTQAVSRAAMAVASAPKLEHFPSPQPLSEQETILARYVTNYPERAALIAQARTEELRRDNAEEMGEAAPTHNEDLQQSNR